MKRTIHDMQRWSTYTGVVSLFSMKNDAPDIETVLLVDIQDLKGEIIRDHMWFLLTGCLDIDIEKGDVIEFVSRAEYPTKGFRRQLSKNQKTRCYEFKMAHPIKARKIE